MTHKEYRSKSEMRRVEHMKANETPHEELMAKLELQGSGLKQGDNPYLEALRAVVELHTPTPYGHDTWQACMDCSCQDCNTFVVYPCQTIQAIEKELQ